MVHFYRPAAMCLLICFGIAGTAYAGELLPKSEVCLKESSIRDVANANGNENFLLPRDCYHAKTLLKVERISCAANSCRIRVWRDNGEFFMAYTLRRYQP